MIWKRSLCHGWLSAMLGITGLAVSAMAQGYYGQGQQPRPDPPFRLVPAGSPQAQQLAPPQVPHRVAQNTPAVGSGRRPEFMTRNPGEHPLMPAIRWARDGLRDVQKIQDYSAVLVKRELVNGKLTGPEYIFTKVRHEPLSAYCYFLDPENLRGQEVIYIEGQNNGKMWAHGTGFKKVFGTVSLDPNGPIAMQGNRYPITEIGMLTLVQRMLEVAERETQYGECEVHFFPGAKINGSSCTCIQVMHPVPRRNFIFHLARIFIDDELNLPVRYEAYGWPSRPGGKPVLEEEYTYLNVKLNNGFTDADFDIRNPNYQFMPHAGD